MNVASYIRGIPVGVIVGAIVIKNVGMNVGAFVVGKNVGVNVGAFVVGKKVGLRVGYLVEGPFLSGRSFGLAA